MSAPNNNNSSAIRDRLRALRAALPAEATTSAHTSNAARGGERQLAFPLAPSGAIARGALVELSGPHGSGKTEALLKFLTSNHPLQNAAASTASDTDGGGGGAVFPVAWVLRTETALPYPRALDQHGLPLAQILWIEARDREEMSWCALQLLRSSLIRTLVLDSYADQGLMENELKRLQILARQTRTTVFFIGEERVPARARWLLNLKIELN
ncbi:MAG: hypothetical protein AAB425_02705, partial [Bdellovibrionota bacterium]